MSPEAWSVKLVRKDAVGQIFRMACFWMDLGDISKGPGRLVQRRSLACCGLADGKVFAQCSEGSYVQRREERGTAPKEDRM